MKQCANGPLVVAPEGGGGGDNCSQTGLIDTEIGFLNPDRNRVNSQ